jgi:hypothetical protein
LWSCPKNSNPSFYKDPNHNTLLRTDKPSINLWERIITNTGTKTFFVNVDYSNNTTKLIISEIMKCDILSEIDRALSEEEMIKALRFIQRGVIWM